MAIQLSAFTCRCRVWEASQLMMQGHRFPHIARLFLQ